MATLETIQRKIERLRAQAEEAATKQLSAVIERIRGIMEKHDLTVADVAAHLGEKRGDGRIPRRAGNVARASGQGKGKLPPKYMNPATGETWSGHARPPRWIAGVKDRTRFLIDDGKAARKQTVSVQAKGKLPPKYRDPKTGATWSGHARPPAWIRNVKDRSPYLI
ncbi:H-NS family nucleoid-associated regulatory protein [Paraburkholderia sp. SARCC-3016]|jgi:DNA-binding protein H-NS|uniref:H-NS histone family protein n=1 Tax=Paraburkholderia sp. SARCC-3016 TaxID=3058611 RepID=UPI002808B8D6|nr:H-NS family nucleoid-associated regulatory protein [Paraburkholderia sp. SARCC-3016]MDQ7981968.1 H-NS family nucleoid-associated regulatory protein [Paraburkholderia sp. SARCC-3016]